MNDELKTEVYEILKQYPIGVVATINAENAPEAAIVGLSVAANLDLLFGTSHKTRKYANLQRNTQVAVTVGDFKAEVQYEGTAQQVSLEEAVQLFGNTPGIERYKSDPAQTWWHVSPTWLRLTVHGKPDRIVETRLA